MTWGQMTWKIDANQLCTRIHCDVLICVCKQLCLLCLACWELLINSLEL